MAASTLSEVVPWAGNASSRFRSTFLPRALLALTLILAAACSFPLVADASKAFLAPTTPTTNVTKMMYTADPGEVNVVSISRIGGYYHIVDHALVVIVPTMPCEHVTTDPVATNHVRCPADTVRATLGDGDDQLTVDDSAYPENELPNGQLSVSASGDLGSDTLIGGVGRDEFQGGLGNDPVILGGGGRDSMSGGDGGDMLDGGADADTTIFGGDGKDTVLGGPGDDGEVLGGEGDDYVDGEDGKDDVRGNQGADTILGGAGNDRLDFRRGDQTDPSGGADTLEGGPGDDMLNGGPPPPADSGSQEDGVLESDRLRGGDGFDRADFGQRTESLAIELDGDANDGEVGEGDNVQPDVECLIGGSSDDTLIGSSAANCLDGRDGADIIEARGGDDTLQGGVNDPSSDNLSGESGNDTMMGGSGDDSLVGGGGGDDGSGEGGSDRVDGEAGNDSLGGGAGVDRVDGGGGNDLLFGGGVSLRGGDASDELLGGRGADRLRGGQGNDRLDGGLGADYISGESDRDTVTYEDRTNRVFVTLDGEDNDGEAREHDNVLPDVEVILAGIRGDNLSGDVDGDTVAGESGQDLIGGNLGRDRLLGGDAADVVMARDGDRDEVVCGAADGDLAIADDRDKVIECDTVDRPGARRPILGRYALVRPEGKFRLQLPQGPRFFGLKQKELKIRIGSTVDPKADVVRLVTARNNGGARQVASVSKGRFGVLQRGRRGAVTKLRLAGRLPDCRGSSTQEGRAKRAARSSPRRLRVAVARRNGNRGPRVLGKWSRGAAAGTEWLTEDRCDGTLTTVKSGTVRVRDFGRGRTVMVRPGKPYLARAE